MCVSNLCEMDISVPLKEGRAQVQCVEELWEMCAEKCVGFGGRLGEVRARGVSEVGKSRELGPPRVAVFILRGGDSGGTLGRGKLLTLFL